MTADTDKQYATSEEVRDAIERLSTADHAKLVLIARSFCRARVKGTVVEPLDLLHHAITKTLEGQQRWNKRVSIIRHLDRAMESDSGHIIEQNISHDTESLEDLELELAGPLLHPLDRLSAHEQLNEVLDLFIEDKIARDLLLLKGQGFSASEIQRELGIEKVQYETVTKRIRRHYVQHLLEGGPSDETKRR